MNSIRTHLSYANIVATLALVFAMGGSALAARHYLINSTRQINPKVIKKLRGNTGKTGPSGPQGAAGAKGTAGAEGTKGADGFSALSSLPPGRSESGDYAFAPDNTGTGFVMSSVTFPVPLAAALPIGQVVYTRTWPVAHCAAPGSAAQGFLCIYGEQVKGFSLPTIYGSEGSGNLPGAGRFGLVMEWTVEAAQAFEIGTYTVTAP